MLQTNYESKTEFYCTNCAEKDQRIKELEQENALLQKALTLAIKKLKKLGYAFGKKEIMKEVKKC